MPSLAARALVIQLTGAWGIYLVRNPTPGPVESLLSSPLLLFFTGPAAAAYLFLVRSWWGSAVAGAAYAFITLAVLQDVSRRSETSSTAGIGATVLTPYLLVPILLTFGAELLTERRRRLGMPPPPEAARTSAGSYF